MARASYVIGLGSNRPHGRHGRPEQVLAAAIEAMRAEGLKVARVSRTVASAPLGPSDRRFANAAVLVRTGWSPPKLLKRLKRIERDFGRRKSRRWGARVLDCDILAWSEGAWVSADLVVPHIALAERRFALGPAAEIAPGWRHPFRHLSLVQLHARLTRRRPAHRGAGGADVGP
jgi:2-amino-4-hydroxy-6-hydroxymethyldihydropteridine diphosphokinase